MRKLGLFLPLFLASCGAASSCPPPSSSPILDAPTISLNGSLDGYGLYAPAYRGDGTSISPNCCDGSCIVTVVAPTETNGSKGVLERTPVPYGDGSFQVAVDFPKEYSVEACVVYFDQDGKYETDLQKPLGWYSPLYETSFKREIIDGVVTIGSLDKTDFAHIALSIQFSSSFYGRGSTTFLLSDPRI